MNLGQKVEEVLEVGRRSLLDRLLKRLIPKKYQMMVLNNFEEVRNLMS